MNDLTLNILGFAAANKDLTVQVRDPVNNQLVREVRPFLDGTVRVPQLPAGSYEVTVTHPNLTLPILRRPIRVFPGIDTKVSLLIDPSQFKDTPIEDIPEANLTPVLQMTDSVHESVLSLAVKKPGEAILAADWNQMAGGIRDLAQATGELTRLVSPQGHDHPELVSKIDQITGNFNTLVNMLSAAVTELQRQIQTLRIRRQIEDVLDKAGVNPASPQGKDMLDLADALDRSVTDTPTVFGRTARNVGVQLGTKVEALMDAKQADPLFAGSDEVKGLSQSVDSLRSQQATTYDAELAHLRLADRQTGTGGLNFVLKK